MGNNEHGGWRAFNIEMRRLWRKQRTFEDYLDLEIESLKQNIEEKNLIDWKESNKLDDSTFVYFALKTLSNLEPNNQFFPAINCFTDWDSLLKIFVREARVAFYPEEDERVKEKQWAMIGKRLAFEKLENTVEGYRQTIKNKSTNVMAPINETIYFRRYRVFLAITRSVRSVAQKPEQEIGVEKAFLRILDDENDVCGLKVIPYDQHKLNSNDQELAQRHKTQIDSRNRLRRWLFKFAGLDVSLDTLKSSIRDARKRLKPYLRPANELGLPEILKLARSKKLHIDDEDAFKAINRYRISKEHENWQKAYAHYMESDPDRDIHPERLNLLFD